MASKRNDPASLRHLAAALEATHLSLRKVSPGFEAHYRDVQAAAAAAQKEAHKGGTAGKEAAAAAPVPAPPPLRPGSCPPPGMAAWAAHFEEHERCVRGARGARGARARGAGDPSDSALSWRVSHAAAFFFANAALRTAPSAARARWTCRGR